MPCGTSALPVVSLFIRLPTGAYSERPVGFQQEKVVPHSRDEGSARR